jgi:hypothetical protein
LTNFDACSLSMTVFLQCLSDTILPAPVGPGVFNDNDRGRAVAASLIRA